VELEQKEAQMTVSSAHDKLNNSNQRLQSSLIKKKVKVSQV
jgi:hypothetical protein